MIPILSHEKKDDQSCYHFSFVAACFEKNKFMIGEMPPTVNFNGFPLVNGIPVSIHKDKYIIYAYDTATSIIVLRVYDKVAKKWLDTKLPDYTYVESIFNINIDFDNNTSKTYDILTDILNKFICNNTCEYFLDDIIWISTDSSTPVEFYTKYRNLYLLNCRKASVSIINEDDILISNTLNTKYLSEKFIYYAQLHNIDNIVELDSSVIKLLYELIGHCQELILSIIDTYKKNNKLIISRKIAKHVKKWCIDTYNLQTSIK